MAQNLNQGVVLLRIPEQSVENFFEIFLQQAHLPNLCRTVHYKEI